MVSSLLLSCILVSTTNSLYDLAASLFRASVYLSVQCGHNLITASLIDVCKIF